MGCIGAQTRRNITLEQNKSRRIKEEYEAYRSHIMNHTHLRTLTSFQQPNTHSYLAPAAPAFNNPVPNSDIDVLNELLSELQRLDNKYMPDNNIKNSDILQLLGRRIKFRVKGKCKLDKILRELSNLNCTLSSHQNLRVFDSPASVFEAHPGLYQHSTQTGISTPPTIERFLPMHNFSPNNTPNNTTAYIPSHQYGTPPILPPIPDPSIPTIYFELSGDNTELGRI